MGNNSSKTNEYYNSLQINPNQYDLIDISDMNPYEVFDLNDQYTFDELKDAYRRVARLVHPDKGGSQILFNKITECFKHLAKEYKLRQIDRPHNELKKDFNEYTEKNKETSSPIIPIKLKPDENFNDRFNNTFEQNKLEDEEFDGGYGHIMDKSSGVRDDINITKLLKGKYNSDTFNKTFDTITLPNKKDVVIYKEPEPLPMSKSLQYTELGSDKPGDYSNTKTDNSLKYTDYMKAYTTTRLVDPRSVSNKDYKSIKELEIARENAVKNEPTEEELKWIAIKEKEEKMKEEHRLSRLEKRDKMITEHHERVNRLLIK
jgi:curved DNA-binding protein CbpA